MAAPEGPVGHGRVPEGLVPGKRRCGTPEPNPDPQSVELTLVHLTYAPAQSLYKGIDAKLWQTVLTSAFMFLAYEKLHRLILAVFVGSS